MVLLGIVAHLLKTLVIVRVLPTQLQKLLPIILFALTRTRMIYPRRFSHSSTNYGPGQSNEKLIPHIVSNCLSWKPISVSGYGANVRDWVYVDDHAEAIWQILQSGRKGETYDIGGDCQKSNFDLIHLLIDLMAEETKQNPENYRKLIRLTENRSGHDFRYSMDFSKIKRDLNWHPKTKLIDGLKKTIRILLRKQISV